MLGEFTGGLGDKEVKNNQGSMGEDARGFSEEVILEVGLFFFLRFIYLFIRREREREREAETQAEGEAGSMQGARCGTRSWDSRIMP